VEVASVGVGTADWFDSWEQNGNEGSWQQKTTKLELRGGAKYYLEAEQHGIAPSRGMRIAVQIHNTWLSPDVVNTYLLEKHQIRARAQRLPEIQIQTTIEELLVVKCNLEPVSARILVRLGFEQDVPVHMSSRQLHKLLRDNADESTSGYLHASDFTVTKDLNSCYEHEMSKHPTDTALKQNHDILTFTVAQISGAANVDILIGMSPCVGLPKLMVTFPVSLAFLCDLKHAEDNCEVSSHTYLQCDLTVAIGTKRLPGSWPYLYLCEENSQCLFAPDHWTEPAFPSFSGLFLRVPHDGDNVTVETSQLLLLDVNTSLLNSLHIK
ncbi:hypothetical protein A6R68_11603, partial [Neotoma lepida]